MHSLKRTALTLVTAVICLTGLTPPPASNALEPSGGIPTLSVAGSPEYVRDIAPGGLLLARYTGVYPDGPADVIFTVHRAGIDTAGLAPVATRVVPTVVRRGEASASVNLYAMTGSTGRYQVSALMNGTGVVNKELTIIRSPATIVRINERANADVHPFDGRYASYAASSRTMNYETFEVAPALGQRVTLMRKSGKRWIASGTPVRLGSDGGAQIVKMRLPRSAGLQRFRLRVDASSGSKAANSATLEINLSDTKKHAAQIRRARKYIAKYCPKTPVYVVRDEAHTSGAGSQIGFSRTDGKIVRFYQDAILLSPSTSARTVRAAALHGCATIISTKLEMAPLSAQRAHDRNIAKIFKAGKGDRRSVSWRSWQRFEACLVYSISKDRQELQDTRCSRSRIAYVRKYLKTYTKTAAQRDPYFHWTS
ncbi:hypothetical protein GCM10011331_15980 [Flavimobilis marinus]|uniref:Uncharacterized protein n=1 Tax=Flavimobilis marinus TaxID=285351 RepID=A0A1I2FL44_9MICO|nr:hypothetical protein [Flavimobilis marinus]GHG51870.1 hypothetical protein GCM10011331_15980 [Flavimobilis marinus]SFF05478.1 hypothetical protein SAMN04488035_1360 [Flavimobilis marinus]